MMNKDKIVIVGGGTSGWMAANMLAAELPSAAITVIETDAVPTIGVGEGSTPFFKAFFERIGIAETEWMPACHATYKTGITFPGWSGEITPNSYFHPFYSEVDSDQVPVFFAACAAKLKGFDCHAHPDDFFVTGHLAQSNKAPLHDVIKLDYGYHFDAGLLGEFLKKTAIGKGVKHLRDKVTHVYLTGDDTIASIDTENSGQISATWYIDCTGFRRLLIQSAMKQRFVSYRDSLLCDAAVALSRSRNSKEPIKSSTLSTAVEQGWIWEIPLSHRTGTGLVYSERHNSQQDAIDALCSHLKQQQPEQWKSLKWHPGRMQNSWVGNCVAIGLSQGFLEPLEAPMLNITQQSISLFIESIKSDVLWPQEAFNQQVAAMFEGTRDYVQAHYLLNQRHDSSFWSAARESLVVSEGLAALLQSWSKGMAIDGVLRHYPHLNFYLKTSWYCLLSGLDFYPKYPNGKQDLPAHSAQIITKAQQNAMAIANQFSDHVQTLHGHTQSAFLGELSFA